MQPDPGGQAAVSESSDAPSASSPSPSPEPANGASSSLGTLADAFRSDPEALKGRVATGTPPQADADRTPPEESAATDASAAASKPGEQADGGPSRRGAAARITEQQAEIERLVAEREAERVRIAEAEARVRAQDEKRQASLKAAMDRIGDDRDFEALSAKRMRGEVLSYEDDEKLNSMLSWREHAADLWEMADRSHKAFIGRSLLDRVEKYGLDRGVAFDAALPELLDHAVSTTEARVRAELNNQIAELKAELKGWRARGSKAASPTVGGSSDDAARGVPPDGASPLDFFRAGARQREGAAPRAASSRR